MAEGYEREVGEGLPLVLAFVGPAFILHTETRRRLPKIISSKLPEWAGRNPDLISELPDRISETRALCGQSVLLGSSNGFLQMQEDCSLKSGDKKLDYFVALGKESQDLPDIYKKSVFLGRWLSHSGTEPTILSILGVGISHAYQ